ncbi:MAG: hypothetical protein QNJ94_18590 [Alphaproteobacteria bacterium]|nr:hypothetical protein [Alphaproteobacteria bacterium]
MALDNRAVFPQEPKTAGISFAGSSQSTQMDPATVAPTTLLTAGSDGALVTRVEVTAEGTVTAEKVVLWVQPGGSGNWYARTSAVLAAYTQAATDAQGSILLVDPEKPDTYLALAAGDVVGITHHVDQQSMVFAEYRDY